jgi:hypothetical protein
MGTTLRAMRKVSEIKHKRQDLFFKMRMRAHKGKQREEVRAVIEKGIENLRLLTEKKLLLWLLKILQQSKKPKKARCRISVCIYMYIS